MLGLRGNALKHFKNVKFTFFSFLYLQSCLPFLFLLSCYQKQKIQDDKGTLRKYLKKASKKQIHMLSVVGLIRR